MADLPANLPSQEEIMASWSTQSPPVVSVLCLTYNHGPYIAEALSSFLSQRTQFPFEILVHDDASTDDNAAIIQAFAEKYPGIIKPILQSENQFSKGNFKPTPFTAAESHGKYIAMSDGDDYWIAANKLSAQVDAMERHAGSDFCCHPVYKRRGDVLEKRPDWYYGREARILDLDTVLRAEKSFAPTSSYMFRREIFDQLPPWYFDLAPVGDLFLEIYGARRGGVVYLPDPMSVQRMSVAESWSSRMRGNIEMSISHQRRLLECFERLAPDIPAATAGLDYKRALTWYRLARHCLLAGDFNGFRDAIVKSRTVARISRAQSVLYLLRAFPPLTRLMVSVTDRLLWIAQQLRLKLQPMMGRPA